MANRYGVTLGASYLTNGRVEMHGQNLTQQQVDALLAIYDNRPDIRRACGHGEDIFQNHDVNGGLAALGCMSSWISWGGGGQWHVTPAELEALDPGGWPYVGIDHRGAQRYAEQQTGAYFGGGLISTPAPPPPPAGPAPAPQPAPAPGPGPVGGPSPDPGVGAQGGAGMTQVLAQIQQFVEAHPMQAAVGGVVTLLLLMRGR